MASAANEQQLEAYRARQALASARHERNMESTQHRKTVRELVAEATKDKRVIVVGGGLSVLVGLYIGSQIQRIGGSTYGTWVNLGLLVIGGLVAWKTRTPVGGIVALGLVSAGSVGLSAAMTEYDLVPGQWDNTLQADLAKRAAEAAARAQEQADQDAKDAKRNN